MTASVQTSLAFDARQALADITRQWDGDIVAQLTRYIAIPAKSPAFDADWEAHGFIDAAARQAADWALAQGIAGLTLEVIRLPGRTPVVFFEVAATRPGSTQTALMYGHLDKQPEFTGWRADLGPWSPKYENGRLYGRGGADDGYAIYAAISAIGAIQAQGAPHPRIVGLIETSEESGSPDLPAYLELLQPRLGDVGLVACLDSGAGDYERLWLTTSLRGLATGWLRVQVLDEGVHSGDASGIAPSSMRVMRTLLDRLEDSRTGRVLLEGLHCPVPPDRVAQARETADVLGGAWMDNYAWTHHTHNGQDRATRPMTDDPAQALLNRTWLPALSITGVDGFPAPRDAGNVLRPWTALKLSMRLPPTIDAEAALAEMQRVLQADPPYQAKVTFTPESGAGNGWNAPAAAPWFDQALAAAARDVFGAPCGYLGQGGTIPLINLLGQTFPAAQMLVCGVLGPGSNAHGPNEFLHVPYAKRLTAAVARVLAGMP